MTTKQAVYINAKPSARHDIYGLVEKANSLGLTESELDGMGLLWDRKRISSVLSVMHGEGILARLVLSRKSEGIYVVPAFVRGREQADRVYAADTVLRDQENWAKKHRGIHGEIEAEAWKAYCIKKRDADNARKRAKFEDARAERGTPVVPVP